MGADPIPDSFEKTALFTPAINDPRKPPTVASKLKALEKILKTVSGSKSIFITII